MATLIEQRTRLWLKQHGGNEQRLAKAIATFFRQQLARILDALDSFSSLTDANVSQLLRVDDEHDKFMPIVRRHLYAAAAMGAKTQLDLIPKRQTTKAASDDFLELRAQFNFLPNDALLAIEDYLTELDRQPYWLTIQQTTQDQLTKIIRVGLSESETNQQIAKRIRETLGGTPSKARANAIARTEVTGALNAGHEAAYATLQGDGTLTGKRWLTIRDKSVRKTHSLLHDTTVKPGELFSLGGSPTPFPGHWSLPVEERVNCRCTTIGITIFDSLATETGEPAREELLA